MIVVTAPTSNIGRQIITELLNTGERIRVVARDPSRLPVQIRERFDVVEGSHSQRDVVTKAFEGADSVFWFVPADPRAASDATRTVLSIRDNGGGLRTSDSRQGPGIGLQLMRYRAGLAGGTLHIGSSWEHGTEVSCTIMHMVH